jgi:hypothetical protein
MASSKEQARHLLNIEQDYGEYERYLQEQAASEQQQYYDEQDDASSGQDEEDESD